MRRVLSHRDEAELLAGLKHLAAGGRVPLPDVDRLAANTLSHYLNATDEQRRAGHSWYPAAREWVSNLAGATNRNYPRSAAMIAALSPQSDWDTNLYNGAHFLLNYDPAQRGRWLAPDTHAHAQPGDMTGHGLNTLGSAILAAMNIHDAPHGQHEQYLSGPKVNNFYRNFLGDDQAVTIDTHMARAMNRPHGSDPSAPYAEPNDLNLKRRQKGQPVQHVGYDAYADAVRKAAAQAGVPPSAMQATVWLKYKDDLDSYKAAQSQAAWEAKHPGKSRPAPRKQDPSERPLKNPFPDYTKQRSDDPRLAPPVYRDSPGYHRPLLGSWDRGAPAGWLPDDGGGFTHSSGDARIAPTDDGRWQLWDRTVRGQGHWAPIKAPSVNPEHLMNFADWSAGRIKRPHHRLFGIFGDGRPHVLSDQEIDEWLHDQDRLRRTRMHQHQLDIEYGGQPPRARRHGVDTTHAPDPNSYAGGGLGGQSPDLSPAAQWGNLNPSVPWSEQSPPVPSSPSQYPPGTNSPYRSSALDFARHGGIHPDEYYRQYAGEIADNPGFNSMAFDAVNDALFGHGRKFHEVDPKTMKRINPLEYSLEDRIHGARTPRAVSLYRGLEHPFDPDYPLDRTDAPYGYATFTDSPELARQYAGDRGYVYRQDFPRRLQTRDLIDDRGDRGLFVNNEKPAALNGVPGNEYLVYLHHDKYDPTGFTLHQGPISGRSAALDFAQDVLRQAALVTAIECPPGDPSCTPAMAPFGQNSLSKLPPTSVDNYAEDVASGRYDPHAPAYYSPAPSPQPSASPSGQAPSSSSSPASYAPSGGVDQWRPVAEEGLRRNGLPVNDQNVNSVLYQIQTESSGNPNAINTTDSNAAAGHPSQGLLQTIPSTFQTYHLPGDPASITDPQANVDAAINYHKNTYGPQLAQPGGQGIGSGHGY